MVDICTSTSELGRARKFNVIVRTLHLVKYKHLLFIHKTAFKKQLINDLVVLVLSLNFQVLTFLN